MQRLATFCSERLGVFGLVHVLGDLDTENSLDFWRVIEAAALSDGPLIISLLECSYVGGAGLSVLTHAHRAFADRIHVVVQADSTPHRMLGDNGLTSSLRLHETFRDALRDLRPVPTYTDAPEMAHA